MTNNAVQKDVKSALFPSAKSHLRGFSLVEILVVMTIMSLMAVGMPFVVSSISSAGKLTQSASDISSVLQQARAYAMAKNTYVYVGLQEVDGAKPTSANGVGRVAVVVVASLDGTRPYTSGPLNATDLAAISKPQFFNSTHIATASSLVNGSNMTSRPTCTVDLSGTTASTIFGWPLTGTAQFSFSKVIEFDPQGVARVQTGSAYSPAVQSYIEIPLVSAHGNVAATSINDQAAVQVDGVTGAVSIYRP